MMVLLGMLVVLTGCQAGAEEEAIAPGKFIPTYAIKYAGWQSWPPAEEAARFDLIDGQGTVGDATALASEHGNTWQTLKHLNPHIIILLYEMGPHEYVDTTSHQLPGGWNFVKAEHGIDSPDRWVAVGARHSDYIQNRGRGSGHLMNLTNPNWLQFWVEQTFAKFWSGEEPPGKGADGILSDNSGYRLIGALISGTPDGHPDQTDVATDYSRDGIYDPELYRVAVKRWHALSVPWLQERGIKHVVNFGHMEHGPEEWEELDAQPYPPFAAMQEAGFMHPYGTLGRQGNFVFWQEPYWLNLVNTMRGLKHVRVLMNNRGRLNTDAEGIARMDEVDASGVRGWDALWYVMTSFLQGFDDERQNAYMNFTLWSYPSFHWFNEFDPAYLHLGRARGEFQRLEGAEGHVYGREFEDGWAIVNPTATDALAVPVPGGGQARVLIHDTFEHAEDQPLVSQFDLPVHRGVILLKPGKQAGNQDNL